MVVKIPRMLQSETIPRPSQDALPVATMQAAKVVLAYLSNTQLSQRSKAHEVLRELAEQTIERLHSNQSVEITTLNLKAGVAPDAAKEPSGWLSPHWAKLIDAEERWQEGMADEARRLNFKFVPKLEKLPGNPTVYRIAAIPLAEAAGRVDSPGVPEGGVAYTPESIAAPGAWLRKAWKSGVVKWTAGTRWSVAIAGVAGLLLVSLVGWVLLQWAVKANRPVTLADVALFGLFGAVASSVFAFFRFFSELFDMRVVMAPTLLTPLSKDGVTLEIRPSSADSKGELFFGRYTSTCPRCGGNIQLFDGGKAFPERIVGRCSRSGREHVFSFDHVLKVGHPLYPTAQYCITKA